MDLLLLLLAVTAVVLGLLWLTQKFFRVLPRSVNSPATNARLLWGLATIGTIAFWLNSLDRLLSAEKWTLPFCEHLAWVIVLPTAFLYSLKRLVSKHPESTLLSVSPNREESSTKPDQQDRNR